MEESGHRLGPVCDAIARLLSPHAEVVLHDPATDEIVGIWNPLSERSVGDPSLLGELNELTATGQDVYGPYPKSLPDGRRLSSVSAVIRDESGKAEVVLCVNVDRTAFEDASRILAAFAAPVAGQPRVLFEHDWSETLNDIVADFVRERGVAVERLTRTDRLEVLARLDSAGVLSQRRSVPVVARALRISRSALYQLLGEARKDLITDADTP
ncbi:putative transcriptional regulator YheO [Kribbella orskensis]|uniref:Transcriptional regulator YheO n=1 Tax=Kribbella orskensis TaxID=2512216 RepID=A0ABY2BQ51_9ACTN|nr:MULTISPECIES: PAS domain-containing protein [Kribbella]TCN39642.1 putative transcriptional regulator YheO [Kribbella sp. VKM Ac-2500]TCO27575.1 putative transcriptional regulator YheO [Kribbella orskensis]